MAKLAKTPLKQKTQKLFHKLGLSTYFADTLIESLWRDPVPPVGKPRMITQAAHGLSVENAIRYNGSAWVKAQADNDVNAQTRGIVVEVIDTDTFRYQTSGFFESESFVAGGEYCLSPDVAGLMILIPADDPFSWVTGQVRQTLGTGVPGGFEIAIGSGQMMDDIVMVTGEGIQGTGLEDDPIRPVYGNEENTVCQGNDPRLNRGVRITGLTNHLQTIVFPTVFSAIPAGRVEVFRMAQVAPGIWREEDVLWGFTSADNPTTTGFELEIDSSENLTGIILQYYYL